MPRTTKKPATPAAPTYEISSRVARQARTEPTRHVAGAPAVRPLRIYTLDPSVSYRLGGVATVSVPYEELEPGPVGRLFAVTCDKAPDPLTAEPLDLDQIALLLTSGLSPTPADGRFPLQMVYAVCSLTYATFRRALGRDLAWACAPVEGQQWTRLKVRPFGMYEKNAYYDRDEGGLAFGWFHAEKNPAGHTIPHGLVFTALSHDVVTHETTHALLDSLRSEFASPMNPDVLGFHEGFADVIALLQHFTFPEVVAEALRESRGSLGQAALLTGLAREFGYATSHRGSVLPLRSAVDVEHIDTFDADALAAAGATIGPLAYRPDMEPHQMGTVLVSAIFEAFATVFRRKSARYFRIAGIDPKDIGTAAMGDELVKLVAQEASDIAGHFLDICIRAIDYCPPVDMDMGEYLRALITADLDVVADDRWCYRESLMRSFQRRRIFPDHVAFMSEDAVRWQRPSVALSIPELAFSELRFNGDPSHAANETELLRQANILGRFVTAPANAHALHLVAPGSPLPKNVTYASLPIVQSVRTTRRASENGSVLFDLVAEVTQSCTVKRGNELMDFMGGCTLIIDPFGEVRYAVYKKIDSADRQKRQYESIKGPLRKYWKKAGKKFVERGGTFKLMHGMT
ncbi:MAG: peptidase M4 [Gemmatimonadaceae bacterium]